MAWIPGSAGPRTAAASIRTHERSRNANSMPRRNLDGGPWKRSRSRASRSASRSHSERGYLQRRTVWAGHGGTFDLENCKVEIHPGSHSCLATRRRAHNIQCSVVRSAANDQPGSSGEHPKRSCGICHGCICRERGACTAWTVKKRNSSVNSLHVNPGLLIVCNRGHDSWQLGLVLGDGADRPILTLNMHQCNPRHAGNVGIGVV